MSLRLIIEDFEGDRMVVPLPEDEGPLTLGRGADNHVRLPERNVSRRHAQLSFVDQSWRIRDTDSYNGVRVNGESIEDELELRVGDFVQLGNYQLLLGSEQRPLEEDVSALAAASAKHQQVPADPYEEADMFGLLSSSGFPTSVDPLGSSSAELDYEIQASEDAIAAPAKGRRTLTALAIGGVLTVAVVAAWNMGRKSRDAKLRNSVALGPTQEALASAVPKNAGAQAAARGRKVPPPKVLAAGPSQKTPPPPPLPPGGPGAGPIAPPTPDGKDLPGGLQDSAGPGASPVLPGEQAQLPSGPSGPSSDAGSASPGSGSPGADNASKQTGKGTSGSSSGADKPAADAGKPGKNSRAKRRSGGDRSPRDAARQAEQAKQWVKRARKAAMGGRHQEALSLARRSFRAQPSQDALQVMGLAACKLQRRKQAEFAYQRMRRDDSRRTLQGICSKSGIDL